MSNFELALKLFLQMAVILGTCRLISLLGRRYLGQTEVVCEMIAGVLLGPSLLGLISPAAKEWLFPSARLVLESGQSIPNPSMSILFAISQVGIVLYMFLIGLEFNTALIKGRLRSAGLVSGAGILVPFVLGGAVALLIRSNGTLFADGIGPFAAAYHVNVWSESTVRRFVEWLNATVLPPLAIDELRSASVKVYTPVSYTHLTLPTNREV